MAAPARAQRIRRRLEKLEALSSPPASLQRILALAADVESSIEDLAQAIQSDPAVAAQLLRLANSAYFSFSSPVSSVRKAIVVLGYRTVQSLAACVALAPAFHGAPGSLDRSRVWLHSCAVAEAARSVALRSGSDAPVAYVAGLLHDIGHVALDEAIPREYAEVLAEAEVRQLALPELEQQRLALDHGAAGAWLAEAWRLPQPLVETIRSHEVAAPPASALARTVRIAELLARVEGWVGVDPQLDPGALNAEVLAELGLERSGWESLLAALKARRDAIEVLHRESWKGTA